MSDRFIGPDIDMVTTTMHEYEAALYEMSLPRRPACCPVETLDRPKYHLMKWMCDG
jgi:hypothetical protein